ncbi:hypothetical protein SARC_07579 [Sphaeroforma arctica JP610]|uniref:Uncharacterized protein n=1 Tax=Sphaeroforma arctica JP610 TaxID=667725 RepID=A0A0L0FTB8_9EUKA|nr:hypothetical protein SARC_07579 [Sphaeroforma arctica JP610]KNC80050.1 hypothetical protein SARC_07579 [Sphaeroforma arctica JP610]|eukprot:XP_014153952.1 hypothetical protein SARC_07579 [Sphaeroforma arctica JP610]
MGDKSDTADHLYEVAEGVGRLEDDKSINMDLTVALTHLLLDRLATTTQPSQRPCRTETSDIDVSNIGSQSASVVTMKDRRGYTLEEGNVHGQDMDALADSGVRQEQESNYMLNGSKQPAITVKTGSSASRSHNAVGDAIMIDNKMHCMNQQIVGSDRSSDCDDTLDRSTTGTGVHINDTTRAYKKRNLDASDKAEPLETTSSKQDAQYESVEEQKDAVGDNKISLSSIETLTQAGWPISDSIQKDNEIFTIISSDSTPHSQSANITEFGLEQGQTLGKNLPNVDNSAIPENTSTSNVVFEEGSYDMHPVPIEIILRDRTSVLAEDGLFLQTLWDDTLDAIALDFEAREDIPAVAPSPINPGELVDSKHDHYDARVAQCVSDLLTWSRAYSALLSSILRITSEAQISHTDLTTEISSIGDLEGDHSEHTNIALPQTKSDTTVSDMYTCDESNSDYTQEVETSTSLSSHVTENLVQNSRARTQSGHAEPPQSTRTSLNANQMPAQALPSTGLRWKELAGKLVCATFRSIRHMLLEYRSLCMQITKRYAECALIDLPTNINDLDWETLGVLDVCTVTDVPQTHTAHTNTPASGNAGNIYSQLPESDDYVRDCMRSAMQMYELVKSHCVRRVGVLLVNEYTNLLSVSEDTINRESTDDIPADQKTKDSSSPKRWVEWIEGLTKRIRMDVQTLREYVYRYNSFGAYGRSIGKVNYKEHESLADTNDKGLISSTPMDLALSRLAVSAEDLVLSTRGFFARALHYQEGVSKATALWHNEGSQGTVRARDATHRPEHTESGLNGSVIRTTSGADSSRAGAFDGGVNCTDTAAEESEESHPVVSGQNVQASATEADKTTDDTLALLQASMTDVDVMCTDVHGLLKALHKHRELLERSAANLIPAGSVQENEADDTGEGDTMLCEDAAFESKQGQLVSRGMEVGEFDVIGDDEYLSDEDEDMRAMKLMSRDERIQHMAAKKKREAQARLDASAPLLVMSELRSVLKDRSK